MDKKSLFSSHSLSSCINEGCMFLVRQLPMVSKVLMPYFTVASFLSVLSIAYNIKLNVAVQAYSGVTLNEVIQAMVLYTLSWLAMVVAMSRMFLMFRRFVALEIPLPEDATATKWMMFRRTMVRTVQLAWRSLPYTIWVLVINMPGFPIINTYMNYVDALSWEKRALIIGATFILAVLLAVVLAPMIYTFFCRMMKPNREVSGVPDMKQFDFLVAYRKGFRNVVKILSLAVWGSFLLFIACAVILMPGIVATEAYLSSVEGSVTYGDTALIPAYGYTLMYIIGTIAVTLCGIFGVAYAISLLHLFGDIYSKNK